MTFDPQTATLEELRAAPVPSFIERDTTEIKKDLIAKFEANTGRKLYPAQVEMIMIDLISYVQSMVGEAVQSGLMQNRAVWATGAHLDEIGLNVSTYRLPAQVATSRVQFTLSEVRATSVVVPVGTRVSAGTDLVFRTSGELVIDAGQTTGEADVEALVAGAAHNDLLPGQIEDILDPIAFVASVANAIESGGGSDVEGDDRFRERIVNAFERITKAGSREGYAEHVKAVNPNIVDVAVVRPQPGYIEITPLMNDGISSAAIDAAILAYLDPETIIPMGDYVSVTKAVAVSFDIVMTLKVAPGMAENVDAVAEDVIRDQFQEWTQSLGAQVAPSALVAAARSIAGVVGVDGPAFSFTDLSVTNFAEIGDLTISVQEVPNV